MQICLKKTNDSHGRRNFHFLTTMPFQFLFQMELLKNHSWRLSLATFPTEECLAEVHPLAFPAGLRCANIVVGVGHGGLVLPVSWWQVEITKHHQTIDFGYPVNAPYLVQLLQSFLFCFIDVLQLSVSHGFSATQRVVFQGTCLSWCITTTVKSDWMDRLQPFKTPMWSLEPVDLVEGFWTKTKKTWKKTMAMATSCNLLDFNLFSPFSSPWSKKNDSNAPRWPWFWNPSFLTASSPAASRQVAATVPILVSWADGQAGISELTACILFSGQYPLIFETYWLPPLKLDILNRLAELICESRAFFLPITRCSTFSWQGNYQFLLLASCLPYCSCFVAWFEFMHHTSHQSHETNMSNSSWSLQG